MKPPEIDRGAANLARMALTHTEGPDHYRLQIALQVYEWAKRNTEPFDTTGELRTYPSWADTQATIASWDYT